MRRHATLAGTIFRFIAAISLGSLALPAQKATVDADDVPVHSSSTSKSAMVGKLKRGENVRLGLVLSGSEGNWCEITRLGTPALSGFVPCGSLQREALPQQPDYSVASSPAAGAPRVNIDAAIAEALRLSGMEQAISQFGDPSLYLSLMQHKQLTPKQAAEVRRMVMQSMRPERFQQGGGSELEKRLSGRLLPAASPNAALNEIQAIEGRQRDR